MQLTVPISSLLLATSVVEGASFADKFKRNHGDMSSRTNQCGSSDTGRDAPNGSKYWLNCGMDSGGWAPAYVQVSDLSYLSDDEALASQTFQPCVQYSDQFKSTSQSTGLPLVLLMSIAMEESTCNAGITGQRGEIGIMQITGEKCDPGANCYEPGYNIQKGGEYLSVQINAQGGNLFLALGGYNGWYSGMQAADSCGPDGQNLDYLNGLVNKWVQGIDGYGNIAGEC